MMIVIIMHGRDEGGDHEGGVLLVPAVAGHWFDLGEEGEAEMGQLGRWAVGKLGETGLARESGPSTIPSIFLLY
jgi:hypothetical protein